MAIQLRVDLIFEHYKFPSIKDIERGNRDADRNSNFQIVGPSQTRPSDMKTALKSTSFKESLVDFLVKSWDNQELSRIIQDTTVYVTTKEKCFSCRNVNGTLCNTEEHHLESDQEEADYRMMLHLADIEEQSNVVVKCNDTDVLIILLGNIEKFQPKNVWIEHGFVSNNSLRFLNVNLLAGNLGSRICKALPSFLPCFHWV